MHVKGRMRSRREGIVYIDMFNTPNSRTTSKKEILNYLLCLFLFSSTPIFLQFASSILRVGSHLSAEERERVLRVLYTWKNIFLDDVRQLEATDLVCHSIPTRTGTRPHRAREPLYTPREIQWQQLNIPKILGARVITYISSPWSAKSRFVFKVSGDLRLVRQFAR